MTEKLRQSLIGLIWPGPIAGPLPINAFRVVAPVLVFYTGPVYAALVMSLLTSGFSVGYFGLLELTGGKEYVEGLLSKLPKNLHEGIETRGPATLFLTSLIAGVFAYAIFLKLLRYSQSKSEALLIAASFLSSFLWTGLFWGGVIETVRQVLPLLFGFL